MDKTDATLAKDQVLPGGFRVLFFMRRGDHTELYRVRSAQGKLCFLKLFNHKRLSAVFYDADDQIAEISLLKDHGGGPVAAYLSHAEMIIGKTKCDLLFLNFIPGESLAERLVREPDFNIYDVKQLGVALLRGLDRFHGLANPVSHNRVIPQNIMLDLSGTVPKAVISGWGHAGTEEDRDRANEGVTMLGDDLHFLAPEGLEGNFSPAGDLYSVGAIMYKMLFHVAPWQESGGESGEDFDKLTGRLRQNRKKALTFPDTEYQIIDFAGNLTSVLSKALHQNPHKRFSSAEDFIRALNGGPVYAGEDVPATENKKEEPRKAKPGKGFEAIAGMQSLKDKLMNDVIEAISHPEEYKAHNLSMPNGMLLYGPPGCGKTFFAERFAEETGFRFKKVVASDLGSIYIHGSQGLIREVFDEARKIAPTILYFDELDAMVPRRDSPGSQYTSGEVNEFLSQLDNIGSSGVFVVGSTNQPDLIDKAVLRAGRLEKWYFIPPPDLEARQALFELYLKKRPLDFNIDYLLLAQKTENYVSSDIKLIIDEASRKTIKEKRVRITMDTLLEILRTQKPTVSKSELKKYEHMRQSIEGGE